MELESLNTTDRLAVCRSGRDAGSPGAEQAPGQGWGSWGFQRALREVSGGWGVLEWNLPELSEGAARSPSPTNAAKWSIQVQPGPRDPEVGDSSRALADGTCLGLNEAWLQVGSHEILHGVGDLVPTQAAENQQLLELVQVLIPDARQGFPVTVSMSP